MGNFESIYTDKQRKAKIKKEQQRLEAIFEKMETNKRKTVEKLIENAAFMAVTLEETRQIVARDGVVEAYQNGENQKGVKKSAAVEVYDKMMNTYSKVIKQLCDLIPAQMIPNKDEGKDSPEKEIMDFIKGGYG